MKLRILFVTDSSVAEARGGAEVSAFHLALGLRELGHEVAFATRSKLCTIREADLFPGSIAAPMWRIPDAGGYLENGIAGSLPLSSLVVRLCKEQSFDIVHAHNWISAYAAHRARSALSGKRREPWVLSLRDYRFLCPSTYGWCLDEPQTGCGFTASARCIVSHSPAPPVLKALGLPLYTAFRNTTWRILRKCLNSFDAFVCCSKFLRLRFIASRTPGKPVLAVPNAVEDISQHTDGSPQGQEILYVGRLSVEKGPDILLTAFRNLASKSPASLRIVGGGPLEARLAEICTSDPVLRGRVKMTGHVSPTEVESYYREASVVVTPSIWPEPLGRVPLESMAAGKPVVATAAGGIPEVVEDKKTGILVPPGSSQPLARALDELLSDRGEQRKMGGRGLRRARLSFSRRIIATRFVKVYEQLIASA